MEVPPSMLLFLWGQISHQCAVKWSPNHVVLLSREGKNQSLGQMKQLYSIEESSIEESKEAKQSSPNVPG